MMIKKTPIVATPIFLRDLRQGFKRKSRSQEDLCATLKKYTGVRYAFLVNSATAGLYISLCALKKISPKQEVILPAYTASSLIIAIQKAGLKPVLCDISREDFNMDRGCLSGLVTPDTLCILGVHMFGLPCPVSSLKKEFPNIFVIEDAAQSFGTLVDGVPVGAFTDIGLFSFNRGKNLPVYGGGCILTSDDRIAAKINSEMSSLKPAGFFYNSTAPFKILALSLAARPFIYGLFSFFIAGFKEQAPARKVKVSRFTGFQAGVALSLFKRIEELSKKRFRNASVLMEGLAGCQGIQLPGIPSGTRPAWNRLPILIKNELIREGLKKRLWKEGVEASVMYALPLHKEFPFAVKKEGFPVADYFAEHLLTLPVHPMVRSEDLARTIRVIREETS